jgi:hypothetical protein
MTRIRIKNELGGKFWNLKIGCVYEVSATDAHQMIEAGDAEVLTETAMTPPPGATKRARKSSKSNAISSQPQRDETPPKSDG